MTNIDDIPTPELTKQAEARQHGSEEIGEFIEWLGQQGYRICQWQEDLTSTQTCYGFDLRGEVISSFDLREPNCDHGKVANTRYRRHLGSHDPEGTIFQVGDECPRCQGRGSLEFPASPRYVESTKTIEQWLADYFEIDQDKIEQERRAILAAFREKNKES